MKTIAQIVLFVLCFFTTNYKAQIYFNNKFDTFGSCDVTNGVDTMYGGYISAGTTCSSLSFNTFVLSLYDLNGTINKKKVFLKPNNFVPNRQKYIKAANNCFFVSGYRAYHTDTSLAFLWKFNSNLDSIKYSEFGFLNKANVVNSFVMHSKYLYHVGYVDSLNTNSDILLIKTDTAGNEIWKKKIGVPGWDENAIMIDTLDGKLIVGGLKILHNTSITYGLAMCLDTAANIIWQNIINTNNGYAAGNIKALKDGTILIYNALKKYTISSNDYMNLQCQKIDINNNQIWIKEYNAPTIGAVPVSAIEDKRGNIVIAAQRCYSPGIVVNGSVNEIAQNGDSLFSREYAYQFGCQNYFRDIVQAPDGGYCFAGFFIPVFANGCAGSQDIWLLKVDSNFCESNVSCGYPTGVRNINFEMGVMSLYPNPAQNELIFKFENGVSEDATIAFMDILGKLVVEYPLQINVNNEAKLNVSELPNGLYYYRIKQHNAASISGKVTILK
jgi:hypothetical protein